MDHKTSWRWKLSVIMSRLHFNWLLLSWFFDHNGQLILSLFLDLNLFRVGQLRPSSLPIVPSLQCNIYTMIYNNIPQYNIIYNIYIYVRCKHSKARQFPKVHVHSECLETMMTCLNWLKRTKAFSLRCVTKLFHLWIEVTNKSHAGKVNIVIHSSIKNWICSRCGGDQKWS